MAREVFPDDRGLGVRIYATSTAQTIASGATDRITLDTLDFNDDASLFVVDIATEYSITVKKAGLYRPAWNIKYSGGTFGSRFAALTLNGSTVIREFGVDSSVSNVGSSDVLRLAANDVLRLYGYVGGGTAVTVESTNVYDTALSVVYQGR